MSHAFGEPGDARFVRALQHTSLDIARGELLCLIGPSGCGKSTLLNVIGGRSTPTTGTVEVGDKPVRGPLPHRHRLRVPGDALFPWCTVIENVKLGMVFQGVPQGRARERDASFRSRRSGSADFADYYPGPTVGRHAPARRAGARLEPGRPTSC